MPDQPRRARVLDADAALAGLLAEWLEDAGCEVTRDGDPDLILVDAAIPRWGGLHGLTRLVEENAGTPIVVLASNFLPGTAGSGALARSLGVAAVLPKPVTREALLAAVDRALAR